MTVKIRAEWNTGRVWLNGREVTPGKSRKFRQHWPSFSWGDTCAGGSLQLACAIAIELWGTRVGLQNYADLTWKYIEKWPKEDLDIVLDLSRFMHIRQIPMAY